jgi:hypothetical protein
MLEMRHIVPQSDCGFRKVVFVAENAETSSTYYEERAVARIETQPTCRQHPQKMPTGKQQYVSVNRPDASYDTVRPSADLVGRFSTGTTVTK